MGNACLSQEVINDRSLTKALKEDYRGSPKKILLLGAGRAGKSTFFKQLKMLYENGYDTGSSKHFIPVIHGNVIEWSKVLARVCISEKPQVPQQVEQTFFDLMNYDLNAALTPELGARLAEMWHQQSVKDIYERNANDMGTSFVYFLSEIERVSAEKYIPTGDDIVRARNRTTAIVEMNFSMNHVPFLAVDVGGQRGERRKWIHCFEGVNAVLFVVAISEYDQVLQEDPTKNGLLEALELFRDVALLPVFEQTSIILFLNKDDIFREKLEKQSGDLRDIFPDYAGGYDHDKAIAFLIEVFEEVGTEIDKTIYTHTTCATDKDQVEFVFRAVRSIIIRENLARCDIY